MRRHRMFFAAASMLGTAAVLFACTLTQSLDYLTKGDGLPPDGGDETNPMMTPETGGRDGGDGGATVVPLTKGITKPDYLQQDANALYWLGGDNNVYSLPKTGGTPKLLGAAPNGAWLAVDADPNGSVFVATGSNVLRFAKDGSGGGPAFMPAEAGAYTAYSIGVDAMNLYLLQIDDTGALLPNVVRMLRDGGSQEVINGATSADSMTVGTKSVFWFDSQATPEMAYAFPKTAAAATPAMAFRFGADDVAPTYPQDAVTDDTALYWTDDTAGVLSLQLTTNAPVIPLYVATDADMFGPIAVDATDVWVIQNQTKGILRVPKTGKPATLVAKGLNTPTSIAVDATNVYVTDKGTGVTGGDIVKIVK